MSVSNLKDLQNAAGDILVIDDDSSSLFLIQDLLTSMGIGEKVTVATSAGDAMRLLRERVGTDNFPSTVFLDIRMPEVDGFGFLEKLENFSYSYHAKPKVVLLSYYGTRAYQEQAEYYGVNAYLRKPLTKEKVLEVLG